jgi:hypothetical protein
MHPRFHPFIALALGASGVAAHSQALDPASARLLAAHNRARAAAGVSPLVWDPVLARHAAAYGPVLSALGRLQHSPKQSRAGERENLWMGTAGVYSPEQMVGTWLAERRYFRPGIFPAVSATGNWYDVAHYTAIIWPTTSRVGCAIYRRGGWDFLVCRYSPPGNIDSRPVP